MPKYKKTEKLTPMQLKFCHHLVFGEGKITGASAARKAGYSENVCRQVAYQLQTPSRYPKVSSYIKELREDQQKINGVTLETHVRDLKELREEAREKGHLSAAVNAEKIRGQAVGLHDRVATVLHGTIDSMSREQVEERLKEIVDFHSPILDHITLDDVKSSKFKKISAQ
jgi:phage terminase small subunit